MSRATKFPAWESEGTAGPSRSISKGTPSLEGSTSTPIQRGGGRPQNVSAADLGFLALLLIGSFALGFAGAVNV